MSISTVFRFGTFNVLHPELRALSKDELVRRSSVWTRWHYPADERVSWYGGAIRPDGGNGMYMSAGQAAAWPSWTSGDIKAGPG